MKIITWERTTEVEVDNYLVSGYAVDLNKLVVALRAASSDSGKIAVQASAASPAQVAENLVFSGLQAAAKWGTLLALSANAADHAEPREATGEDILAAFESVGGTGIFERDENTGEIISIHAYASVEMFEYDASEMSEVLESLQASGVTPQKILGDLAQTSVGLTGSQTQVVGLAEFTLDWKRKTADATTTDDDTYESSLGSTASWSVKAKYMFIDGDPSQSGNILNTITGPQAAQPWNFFPTIGTGRAAFSGLAYVDGITVSTGMGKVVGMDVSLKGTGKLNFDTQLAPVANPSTGTGETAED